MRQMFLVSCVAIIASGCSFKIDLRGGPCVNPDDPLCRNPRIASRPLQLRIYQLRDEANVQKVLQLPWEAFLSTDSMPEGIKPFLASPAETPPVLRPREDFTISSNAQIRESLPRLKATRYLLIVPRGRMPGSVSPILLIPASPFRSTYPLCFNKYDVYADAEAWPCR